jgi:hypothetical protein
MENIDWDKKLETALSKYDFDSMKEAIKNGAKVDNDDLVIHKVINRDRVDLLEYFVFSPELKEHYQINYEYPIFGKYAPFAFAAMCDATECLKFMLEDERVYHIFKFSECVPTAFYYACEGGSIAASELLLSHPKTKDFCDPRRNDFKCVRASATYHRAEFVTHIIMNWDFELVKECMPAIEDGAKSEALKHRVKHLPEHPLAIYKKAFEARCLQEELTQHNAVAPKVRKI